MQFVVTNIGTQQLGAFQISKSVAGDGAELVAQDTVFSFSYTLGDGDPRIVTATPAEASAVVNGLPYGTVVTIDEIAFPPVAGIEWGTPAWSLDGQAVDGPVRFTVGSVDTVDIVATNTATRVFGSFEVTKSVTGAGADLVGDDVPFVVEYSLDGGATWTALDAVTKAAPTVAAPKDIPVGTTVLVREVAPAAIPGVEWGAPAFSGDGVNPASAGEPASFTITESGELVEVTLTNPTTPHNGQFTFTKQITGTGAQLAPAGLEFTLRYSYEGQASPGVMTLKAGTLSSSEAIPTGTTVTVTEVKLADSVLTGGGSWGEPVLRAAGRLDAEERIHDRDRRRHDPGSRAAETGVAAAAGNGRFAAVDPHGTRGDAAAGRRTSRSGRHPSSSRRAGLTRALPHTPPGRGFTPAPAACCVSTSLPAPTIPRSGTPRSIPYSEIAESRACSVETACHANDRGWSRHSGNSWKPDDRHAPSSSVARAAHNNAQLITT